MWLWVCEGQMESVIAKPIGMALRSSFFKNGTSDAMMDRTLSANAKEKILIYLKTLNLKACSNALNFVYHTTFDLYTLQSRVRLNTLYSAHYTRFDKSNRV